MTEWTLHDRLRTWVRSPDPAVRKAAVEDLGAVVAAGEEALAELKRVAATDVPEVADVARRVLAGWPSPQASPVIEEPPPPVVVAGRRGAPQGILTAQEVR